MKSGLLSFATQPVFVRPVIKTVENGNGYYTHFKAILFTVFE